jgi:hypothetical protein
MLPPTQGRMVARSKRVMIPNRSSREEPADGEERRLICDASSTREPPRLRQSLAALGSSYGLNEEKAVISATTRPCVGGAMTSQLRKPTLIQTSHHSTLRRWSYD